MFFELLNRSWGPLPVITNNTSNGYGVQGPCYCTRFIYLSFYDTGLNYKFAESVSWLTGTILLLIRRVLST